MKFNITIGSLEVRSCDIHLLDKQPHVTAEIVQWTNSTEDGQSCWTIARWVKGKEGFALSGVGRRPLDCDRVNFMDCYFIGQGILDRHFNEED